MVIGESFHRWSYLVVLVLGCAVSLFCLAVIGAWLSREKWIGCLLVDAGQPRSRGRVYIWIVYAFMWVAAVVIEPAHYLLSFSTVVLISSGTPLLIGNALEVREHGIFSKWLIISWSRIKSWRWDDAGGRKQVQWSGKVEPGPAIMRMELSRPLFFQRCIRIPVPFARVDAVERALAARVPETTVPERS